MADNEKISKRVLELEKELQEKEDKYVEIYEENNQLHENLLEIKSKIQDNTYSYVVKLSPPYSTLNNTPYCIEQ